MRPLTPVGLSGAFLFRYRSPTARARDWSRHAPNGVTAAGVNYLLNWGFRGGAGQASWYIGLISNAGFSELSQADTHSSHPGWAEFASVLGGVRAQWLPAAATGGVVTGPNAVLQVTAAGSVRGGLLASAAAIGVSAAPVLYATAALEAGLAVEAGGTLSVTYTGRLRNA